MRVIEGRRRPTKAKPRPEGARPHPWAGSAAADGPTAYVAELLSRTLEAESAAAAARQEEALGLLVGDRFTDPASGAPFAVALERVTGPLVSSTTHVRFDRDGFDAVARGLDALGFDYLIVGWFHSHVGLGSRPSRVDLATHQRYFRERHQFALILDPVRREAAAHGLEEGALVPRKLAVFPAAAHLR